MRHWLRDARLSKAYTETYTANLAAISQPYYHNLEVGKKTPSVDVAKRIADVLDIDWTLFYQDNDTQREA